MDFSWNEEQRALRDLARTIFSERSTHDRLKELEAEQASVFDHDLWATMAESGLTGITVPEAHGGAGLGLLALLPVLEEAGRHTAPVPLVATAVGGALTLAEFADADVQATWLPRIAAGEVIATVAGIGGAGAGVAGPRPRLTAGGDGTSATVSGEVAHVPYGDLADLLLVAVDQADGTPALALVDVRGATGVSTTSLVTTNRQPTANVRLDAVSATVLASGDDAITWVEQRLAAAWCAVQAGNCDGAIRIMAAYTGQREQFGKKIAEFQAVAQRAADAFIDTQMVRLTAWNAVFRLHEGWEAAKEVRSATFWAGDGAMRAVHAAQHLHGGIGVDTDYPVHRHFLWAKQIEHTVGTPTRELIRLGALLAAEPV